MLLLYGYFYTVFTIRYLHTNLNETSYDITEVPELGPMTHSLDNTKSIITQNIMWTLKEISYQLGLLVNILTFRKYAEHVTVISVSLERNYYLMWTVYNTIIFTIRSE